MDVHKLDLRAAEAPTWSVGQSFSAKERAALRIYRAMKAKPLVRSEWAIALDVAEQIIRDLEGAHP